MKRITTVGVDVQADRFVVAVQTSAPVTNKPPKWHSCPRRECLRNRGCAAHPPARCLVDGK